MFSCKFYFMVSILAIVYAAILASLAKYEGAAITFIYAVGWHWIWLYAKENK